MNQVDKIVKLVRLEAIVNTYTNMVTKNPEQVETLTKMFKAKLFALENEPEEWKIKNSNAFIVLMYFNLQLKLRRDRVSINHSKQTPKKIF